jgi:hypothetical protein
LKFTFNFILFRTFRLYWEVGGRERTRPPGAATPGGPSNMRFRVEPFRALGAPGTSDEGSLSGGVSVHKAGARVMHRVVRRLSRHVSSAAVCAALGAGACLLARGAAAAEAEWPVRGRVLDASGAVLVRAPVRLRNRGTGFERLTHTDGGGAFAFEGIRRALGGDRFRAIEIGTWREDWPDKRAAAVEEVRSRRREGGR